MLCLLLRRWGNLIGAQGARHLARIKTLVDRGARALYLDSHISPGRFRVQLAARRMFPVSSMFTYKILEEEDGVLDVLLLIHVSTSSLHFECLLPRLYDGLSVTCASGIPAHTHTRTHAHMHTRARAHSCSCTVSYTVHS